MARRQAILNPEATGAPAIAGRFGVQGIPLLVLLRDGEEVDRLVGAVPEAQIRRFLEPHLTAATT